MIHQRKGNIFLCLVIYAILRIDIKVKNNLTKTNFSTFIFQTSISQYIINLKFYNFVYI